MAFAAIWIKEMNEGPKKIRMILKFDTGADGFMKMIYVLAASALAVLLVGIYFIMFYYRGIHSN